MPIATTDSEAPSSHRVSGTSLRVTLSTRRYAKGEDRTADARGLATATLTPQRTGSPTKHFV
ncbi:MAG: hypothetical protein HWQ38_14035 [Nostoc sp. NMS7]|uniref:hypothetical protein n=1 Tax=Nostoc sp. NMS7 TaxID=2815391 RepID=UPI0025EB981C|nr:hypothetical protein [Nostoc sp. NMS7]MBN3947519.1 hypothetical protein [Nostoc sp. NMS7]